MSLPDSPTPYKINRLMSYQSTLDTLSPGRVSSTFNFKIDDDVTRNLKSSSLIPSLNHGPESRRPSGSGLHAKVISDVLTRKSELALIQSTTSTLPTLPGIHAASTFSQEIEIKTNNAPEKTESWRKTEGINRVVKQTMQKMRFKSEAPVEKFENNLKVFKKVNTFINVKDTIQNLNVLNSLAGEHEEDAERKAKSKFLELSKSDNKHYLVMDSRSRPKFRHSSLAKIDSVLAKSRKFISNSVRARDHSRQNSLVGADLVDRALAYGHNKRHDSCDNSELNLFYDQLETDILEGKYDKKDCELDGIPNEIDSATDLDYLRVLLEEKTKLSLVKDKNYHENYKRKAENVITMLKKTAKKIFDRNGDEREKRREALRQVIRMSKSKLDLQKQEIVSFIPPQISENNNTLPGKLQLKAIKGRLSKITSYNGSPTNLKLPSVIKGKKFIEEPTPITEVNQKNKEINALHMRYSDILLNDLECQGKNLHEIREVMDKEIEQLEGLYEREVGKMKEDPSEAIRVNLGTKGYYGSFGNKRLGKPLNSKLISKVIGL